MKNQRFFTWQICASAQIRRIGQEWSINMTHNIYLYILVMAGTTYLIRMLPLVLSKKEITSRYIKSFLYYVPYACLAAMTFPAILYSTASIYSGIAGLVAAVIAAYKGKSLLTVALFACAAVFAAERILSFL